MGAADARDVPLTAPGAATNIAVTMFAPKEPGTYTGHWRMMDPFGQAFGPDIYVQIVVATPPPRPPTPTPIQEWRGVYIGLPADDVLKVWGKALGTAVMGRDAQGLIVKWIYADAALVMKRWKIGRVTCYRVAEIHLR